ncbi:uncharacterized protein V1513DRAFT_423343 [Lipomyces chichibuensis]|uniref:uncharacterized protein n=1 Tax=Lipomyces chichibuensis TaxID=1546026 RepID=UPI00334408DE
MSPRSRRPEDLLKGVIDEPPSIKSKKKPDSIWWKALGRNKKVLLLPIFFLGMTFTVVTMQLTAPTASKQDAAMAISDSIDRKYKNITPEQKVQLLETELRLRGR